MIVKPLIAADAIQARVTALGQELAAWLGGEPAHVIGVLTGGFVFTADLVRAMPGHDLTVEFVTASSYAGTRSTGTVTLGTELRGSLRGRHVVIAEDIVDTGLTLTRLRDVIARQEPASLRIVTLLDKPARRQVPLKPDLVGFTIEDRFVVGYGLDLDGRFRNLPFVGELSFDER